MFSTLWHLTRHWFRYSPRRGAVKQGRKPRRARLEIVPLEDRVVPTALTVFESADNDTRETADVLDLAGRTVIVIANHTPAHRPAGDVDYYRFTAPSFARVWALVDTGGPFAPDATSRHAVLSLENAAGGVVEEDDQDGTATGGDGSIETEDAALIAGRDLSGAARTFFLKVRASDDGDVLNSYRLFVTITTGSADEGFENNSPATATPIGTPSLPVLNGRLNNGGVDYFSFQALAEDQVFIAADGNPSRGGFGPNMDLTLFSPDGSTVLLTANSSGATAFGTDPRAEGFSYTLPSTGTYFVRVRLVGVLGVSDRYDLLVAGNSHPGILQFSAPTFSVNENAGLATITVIRTEGSDGVVSVTASTTATGSTAIAGVNYTPVSQPVTFGDGETSKTVTIPIHPDALFRTRSVQLVLSNATGGATLGSAVFGHRSTAPLHIVDAPPLVAAEATNVMEVSADAFSFSRSKKRTRFRVVLFNPAL